MATPQKNKGMDAKSRKIKASRVLFITGGIATILLKIDTDKTLELIGGSVPVPHIVFTAMFCWIVGLIFGFVAWTQIGEIK